jgi:predicted nuclease of predicted toxin-antitoxin system
VTLPALLADENVPEPALRLLRDAGVDVVSVAATMRRATDREVLEHARLHGRWLLTFDRDYGELVFAGRVAAPPAIMYVRQHPSPPEAFGGAVLQLLRDPAPLVGHLVVLDERSVRRRPLPTPP